jgi:multidrug resistance efflux pump
MKKYCRPLHISWLAGVTVLVLALVGARWIHHPAPADASSTSKALSSRPGKGVVCFGHVDLEHGIASLYPLIRGRVTQVEVNENQEVSAGTILIRLDDYQARRVVQEAEADLLTAQELLGQARKLPRQQLARVSQQRAAIEAVQHRLDGGLALLARKRLLHKNRVANSAEVEGAEALVEEVRALKRVEEGKLRELELNDPSAGVKKAEANVKARRAQLEQARRGLEECALKAPADGTVLRVLVSPGDVLGSQPKQPAVLFCPKGRRLIRAEVEQEFADRVVLKQKALIQDDARGGRSWKGQVMRISDWYTQRRSVSLEPSQFNDVRTLECLIALDPGQAPLRIGQRVRVTLRPGRQPSN